MSPVKSRRPGKSVTTAYNRRQHYTALTYREAIAQLQSLGFEHTQRVPESGMARIPARGKLPRDRSAVISWSPCGRMLHWIEFTTHAYGTVFGGGRTVQVQVAYEDDAVSARSCSRG